MTIGKFGGLAGVVAMIYPASLVVTGVLDSLFGFFPDRPFADDGWVWFLKPAFWTFMMMWIYRHAHDRGKMETLIEVSRAANNKQSEST